MDGAEERKTRSSGGRFELQWRNRWSVYTDAYRAWADALERGQTEKSEFCQFIKLEVELSAGVGEGVILQLGYGLAGLSLSGFGAPAENYSLWVHGYQPRQGTEGER